VMVPLHPEFHVNFPFPDQGRERTSLIIAPCRLHQHRSLSQHGEKQFRHFPVFLAVHQLRVKIISACDLMDADSFFGSGVSDPYVVCRVAGKPGCQFRTSVIKDCLNPVWNEEGEIQEFEEGDELELLVLDKDMLGSDESLGTATIPSSRFFPDGFAGQVPLAC